MPRVALHWLERLRLPSAPSWAVAQRMPYAAERAHKGWRIFDRDYQAIGWTSRKPRGCECRVRRAKPTRAWLYCSSCVPWRSRRAWDVYVRRCRKLTMFDV